jgi:hypothetical protein
LSGNTLSGSVPAALARATSLRVIGLSGNDLRGTLPAELSSLRRLHTLSLRLTPLEGAAPELCAFLSALPLCDFAGTPATLDHCAPALRAPAACRLDAAALAAPPHGATISRREVRGPSDLLLPLVGRRGNFRNATGGRVYYGDLLDVVMPYDAPTVAIISRSIAAGAFSPGRFAPAAAFLPRDPEAVATLGNKARFGAFMAAHAATFGAAVARHLAEPLRRHDYPCVLKVAESAGGEGVYVLRHAADYAKTLAIIGDVERVVQAWAPGSVIGTAHYSLFDGRALGATFFEAPRGRGLSVTRGGIKGFVAKPHSLHAPVFEGIFEALRFTGLACVNYVVLFPSYRERLAAWRRGVEPPAERVTIFEVNPRVGSSLRQAPEEMRAVLLPGLLALEAAAADARAAPLEPA